MQDQNSELFRYIQRKGLLEKENILGSVHPCFAMLYVSKIYKLWILDIHSEVDWNTTKWEQNDCQFFSQL